MARPASSDWLKSESLAVNSFLANFVGIVFSTWLQFTREWEIVENREWITTDFAAKNNLDFKGCL